MKKMAVVMFLSIIFAVCVPITVYAVVNDGSERLSVEYLETLTDDKLMELWMPFAYVVDMLNAQYATEYSWLIQLCVSVDRGSIIHRLAYSTPAEYELTLRLLTDGFEALAEYNRAHLAIVTSDLHSSEMRQMLDVISDDSYAVRQLLHNLERGISMPDIADAFSIARVDHEAVDVVPFQSRPMLQHHRWYRSDITLSSIQTSLHGFWVYQALFGLSLSVVLPVGPCGNVFYDYWIVSATLQNNFMPGVSTHVTYFVQKEGRITWRYGGWERDHGSRHITYFA